MTYSSNNIVGLDGSLPSTSVVHDGAEVVSVADSGVLPPIQYATAEPRLSTFCMRGAGSKWSVAAVGMDFYIWR